MEVPPNHPVLSWAGDSEPGPGVQLNLKQGKSVDGILHVYTYVCMQCTVLYCTVM